MNEKEKNKKDGFIKTNTAEKFVLTAQQKSILNRKANAFFNQGDVAQAEKIFITTGYTDGLRRIGDYYMGKQDYITAMKFFRIAPAPDRLQSMYSKIGRVLQVWLTKKEIQ